MQKPNIGERIKLRREELDMSLEELARLTGYKSRSSISKIENNERNLQQSKIKKFADALGVSPAYIMGWSDEKPKVEEQQEIETRPHEEVLAEIIEEEIGISKAERILIKAFRAYPWAQNEVCYLLGIIDEVTWANGGTPQDAKNALSSVDLQKAAMIARYKFRY